MCSRTSKPPLMLLLGIKWKQLLEFLGITFQENPGNWDFHIGNLLVKASSHLYIL